MQGRIWCEPGIESGSKFCFIIPTTNTPFLTSSTPGSKPSSPLPLLYPSTIPSITPSSLSHSSPDFQIKEESSIIDVQHILEPNIFEKTLNPSTIFGPSIAASDRKMFKTVPTGSLVPLSNDPKSPFPYQPSSPACFSSHSCSSDSGIFEAQHRVLLPKGPTFPKLHSLTPNKAPMIAGLAINLPLVILLAEDNLIK